MAGSYTRRINLYINGKEVKNNIGSIQGEMRKLINEQRRMTVGSAEYNQQFKKIGKLKGILAKHQTDLRNLGRSWTSIAAEKIRNYWGLVASGVASIAGLAIAYKRAADAADHFEERIDNLSALTGLQGQDLESLGRTAQEMSVKVTEGGVRIKQSADDIVDAFTKVGSQRPELLKNKEALAAVTEDAILLSEAAKSDLEPAVKGLTTTMNQFNLPATESRRIINAMAAGSKEGAADIPYLTEAIEKSGTTMNLMNVSLEENIGLIEAIAPNYAKAQMAGNSLDKVFLKIKEKQIGYVNGTFNLNAALEELASRYDGGETAASLFGVEHAKMGELLVQNRGKVQEYTTAVTGSNVAIEQAAKNTNNARAIQAQAKNEFHNAAIELGKNLSPAMTILYQVAGSVATAFSEIIASSPAESLRKEQFEVNNLVKSIVSVNDNQKIRNGLIQELQQKYPAFLENIDSENVSNETLLKTLDDVNKAYLKRIKIAVNQEDITDNEEKMKNVWKEQRELVKDIDKQYQSLVKNKNENATLDEKIAAIAKTRSIVQGYGSVTYASNAGIANLQKEKLLTLTEKENTLRAEYNRLLTEREKIKPNDESTPSSSKNPSASAGITQGGADDLQLSTANKITSALEKLIGEDPEKQEEAIKKYFRDAGDGAFEEFMAAIEARSAGLEFPVSLTEGEATQVDPALDYAVKKYQESLEFQELLLQTKYENGLIGEQEYQDQLTELNRQGEEERLAVKEDNWNKAKQLSQFGLNFVTSLMNMELEAAGDNEEKKKQIRKKYAMAQFLTTASQIVVDTAAAIIKSLAELGPIAGAIAAGIVGATGAAQLAIAYSEMNKVKGYEAGGYTAGDRIYRAGEAGKEWIAPNRMLNDPFTGPVIQQLENFRQRRYSVNPEMIKTLNSTPSRGTINSNYSNTPNNNTLQETNPMLESIQSAINDNKNATLLAAKASQTLIDNGLNVSIIEIREKLFKAEQRDKQSKL